MIEVEHLSRSYGQILAVDDVSFSIPRGELVGLLGHNGAGKTTVMKMLAGYLEPSAGRVRLGGHYLDAQRRQCQRQLGYLPENCPLYPEMTVVEYLDYQATVRGLEAAARPAAVREAASQARPGDVVLLAPACSSFDAYRDFRDIYQDELFLELGVTDASGKTEASAFSRTEQVLKTIKPARSISPVCDHPDEMSRSASKRESYSFI